MHCIETSGLSYAFSASEPILKNIGLQVPQGSIYGFLGPNGAGKTTTLRLLLGLLKKQTGSISVFGKPFDANRVDILKQVGSFIESPSLYGHLTAAENLRVWQKIYQCPTARIPEVLNLVGLGQTGHKKAGKFSLGMKQRLSIAVALLNNPALLILDEPTNGLDPNGMIEVRELLRTLNREQGITILISSHILAEVEKLVTHTGIIHKGALMFQGTLHELMEKQQQGAMLTIETSNNASAMEIIQANGFTAQLREGKLLMESMPKAGIAALNRQLVQAGIDVSEISTAKNNLETIFMDLINN